MALSRFDVMFALNHNQRAIHKLLPATTEAERARRVALVCGPAFVENSVFIEREAAGMRLWGWVSLPTFSRSQADLQYFYVNGRIIRDKLVTHAVKQAYRDVLFSRSSSCVCFVLRDGPCRRRRECASDETRSAVSRQPTRSRFLIQLTSQGASLRFSLRIDCPAQKHTPAQGFNKDLTRRSKAALG